MYTICTSIYTCESASNTNRRNVKESRGKKRTLENNQECACDQSQKKKKNCFQSVLKHRGRQSPWCWTSSVLHQISTNHSRTLRLHHRVNVKGWNIYYSTPWVHDTDIVVAHTTLLFHFINHVPFGNRPWTECQKWTQPLNFKATVNFQNFQIDKWNLTTIDWSSCRSHVMCFSNRFPLNRIIRCNKPTTVLLMNKVLGALWKCWLKNSRQQRTTPSIPQSVTVFMLLTDQSLQTNVNVLIGIHFLMCEK